LKFIDKVQGGEVGHEEREVVKIQGEVDRIYCCPDDRDIPDIVLSEGEDGKALIRISKHATIEPTNSRVPVDTVFWNPWIEKSAAMADLGGDNYPKFLCVEPGTVANYVTVEPGTSLVLTQTLTVI